MTLEAVWQQELDLKGEVCPYTFVKTKLALEDMEPGEVLRVVLDYPESVESVPRSARLQGFRVLSVNQLNETDWEVLVAKPDKA